MAKHYIEVVEAFDRTIELGPLTVTEIRTGEVDVIAPSRTEVIRYRQGEILCRYSKPDAIHLTEQFPDKLRYIGTAKPKVTRV